MVLHLSTTDPRYLTTNSKSQKRMCAAPQVALNQYHGMSGSDARSRKCNKLRAAILSYKSALCIPDSHAKANSHPNINIADWSFSAPLECSPRVYWLLMMNHRQNSIYSIWSCPAGSQNHPSWLSNRLVYTYWWLFSTIGYWSPSLPITISWHFFPITTTSFTVVAMCLTIQAISIISGAASNVSWSLSMEVAGWPWVAMDLPHEILF